MYNFRTDLADERRNIFRKANNLKNEISGLETIEEQKNEHVKVTTVKIINEEGAKALSKPIGEYITIDIDDLRYADNDEIQKASEVLTEKLKAILEKNVQKQDDILVVGLGNEYVTPDALGPKVIAQLDVTRHLFKYLPEYVDENTRPVSGIAPGVLGTTGIETAEILKGIVDNIKPKLLIVIDALASQSIKRISSTIQIADTGIVPGAGVGNTRKELSKETLGVPVIAIGIPTVVSLENIEGETIDKFIEKLQENAQSSEYLNELKVSGDYSFGQPSNEYENMIVTPKEIDQLIENMKDVIARGINFAL